MTIWSKSLSVGIESIDEQHQKIICIINTIDDAIVNGESQQVMNEIVKELLDYSDYHFSYEEELFKKYGYPDAEKHRKEHAELKAQIVELRDKLDARNHMLGWDLTITLIVWLVNHIKTSGRQFGPFLNAKGIK
jgi:hemerythrin-like metal-binding protein